MLWQFVALVAPSQALPPLAPAEIQEILSVCSQPAACAPEPVHEFAGNTDSGVSAETLAEIREAMAARSARDSAEARIGATRGFALGRMLGGIAGARVVHRIATPGAGAAESSRPSIAGAPAGSSGHSYALAEPSDGSGQTCRLTQGRARSYARDEVMRAFQAAGLPDVLPVQGATVDNYIARRSQTENYLVKIDFTAVPKVLPGAPPCDPAVYVQLVVRIPPAHAQSKSDELSTQMRARISRALTLAP